MKLSLITCTGNRPEAYALCEKWLLHQTHGWHQLIVVDDGDPPTKINYANIIIRPEEKWQPGQNTLARNLQLALRCVTGDAVVFIEDDDYYRPMYLANVKSDLKKYDVVGEKNAVYYNLKDKKWRHVIHEKAACLCQTAMRVSYAKALGWMLNFHESNNIDINFWHSLHSFDSRSLEPLAHDGLFPITKPNFLLDPSSQMVIGMKGLPGRPGIGVGHDTSSGPWVSDPHLVKLQDLIGQDIRYYREFLGEQK